MYENQLSADSGNGTIAALFRFLVTPGSYDGVFGCRSNFINKPGALDMTIGINVISVSANVANVNVTLDTGGSDGAPFFARGTINGVFQPAGFGGWNAGVTAPAGWMLVVGAFSGVTAGNSRYMLGADPDGNPSNRTANIEVAEAVIFPSALSADDVDKLNGSILHYHGLQSLLPSGHPYKSSPPTS
jgi:hypothetical protein